jgi:hypothetical protein
LIGKSCSEKILPDFHAYCGRLAADKCRLVEHLDAPGAIGFSKELSESLRQSLYPSGAASGSGYVPFRLAFSG